MTEQQSDQEHENSQKKLLYHCNQCPLRSYQFKNDGKGFYGHIARMHGHLRQSGQSKDSSFYHKFFTECARNRKEQCLNCGDEIQGSNNQPQTRQEAHQVMPYAAPERPDASMSTAVVPLSMSMAPASTQSHFSQFFDRNSDQQSQELQKLQQMYYQAREDNEREMYQVQALSSAYKASSSFYTPEMQRLIAETNKLKRNTAQLKAEKEELAKKMQEEVLQHQLLREQTMMMQEKEATPMKNVKRLRKLLVQQEEDEEQEQIVQKFNDCGNWKQRWQAMGSLPNVGGPAGQLRDKAKRVDQIMDCLDYKLNQNQLGVSLFAAYQFNQKVHRQILTIPAGQGKSRVIVGIITAMNYDIIQKRPRKDPKSTPRKYVVIYNHELQMHDDKEKLERTKEGNDCNVEYLVAELDQEFIPDAQTIYIIDEVDAVLLDKRISFKKAANIIGVTATASTEFKGLELTYIQDELGFTIFDSKIQGNCPEITTLPRSDWTNYFKNNKNMGFIVYLEEKDVSMVRDYIGATLGKVSVDGIKKNFKTDLEAMRNMQSNEVFLVTQPDLMRGFDYGSKCGIALMIARPLDSDKDLKQALGRVNRYGSGKDKIFLLLGLKQTVDPTKSGLLAASVTKGQEKNRKFIKEIANAKAKAKGGKAYVASTGAGGDTVSEASAVNDTAAAADNTGAIAAATGASTAIAAATGVSATVASVAAINNTDPAAGNPSANNASVAPEESKK